MYSLVSITCLLAVANAVIYGEDAQIEDFPYHVSVEWTSDNFMYDGAIINEHWVLSSGYREVIHPGHSCIVRAGTNAKGQGGTVHQVDKIIRHPSYKLNRRHESANDLALMHVVDPFEFDETRKPIELFEGELAPETVTNVTAFNNERILKVVKMPVVDFRVCESAYKDNFTNLPMEHLVCAEHSFGAGSVCYYDWGAPLVFKGRLAGIASYVHGCQDSHMPVLFTEVAHYRDWIHNQARKHWARKHWGSDPVPKSHHQTHESSTEAPSFMDVVEKTKQYVASLLPTENFWQN